MWRSTLEDGGTGLKLDSWLIYSRNYLILIKKMATPSGFEPLTLRLGSGTYTRQVPDFVALNLAEYVNV